MQILLKINFKIKQEYAKATKLYCSLVYIEINQQFFVCFNFVINLRKWLNLYDKNFK